jgi:protein O-GlcNAc transferase
VTQQPFAAVPFTRTDSVQAFELAVSLHDQGRLLEAERLYAVVLKAKKRHFDALLRLGMIRLQQGRFEEAARLLRRSLKIDTNSADAHHSFACALTGLRRSEEAVWHYERALALRPNFPRSSQ